MMQTILGSCVCEAIQYQIDGELGPIYHCHCSKCRRWHGAVFRTRASVHRDQFRWLRGEEFISIYKSSDNVTKTFCRNCGSNLASFYEDRPEVVGIPLGGLDGDIGAKPTAHIFVGSKAPWHEITDGLPQYVTWPESESEVRKTAPLLDEKKPEKKAPSNN